MSNYKENSLSFPLQDVDIAVVDRIKQPEKPLYSGKAMTIGASEFSMSVEGVADFYAADGNRIEYSPHKNADSASLELFMNGSVYGAILHQRRVLPLHGSSLIYDASGVMFCGDSGAGKSSLTTSFCLNGAEFLTDDVTPILFENGRPQIWPKSGKIKLWDDSLRQLKKKKDSLTKIRPENEKYYFEIESNQTEAYPLHTILILQVTKDEEVSFEEVQKVEAFTYLHQEIYRREYLFAMPETEAAYLEQISLICNATKIFRVNRPKTIAISAMREIVSGFISENR